MKVFLLGGTGAIANALPALLAAGYEVSALVRTPEKAAAVRRQGADPAMVSMFDRTAARSAGCWQSPAHQMRRLFEECLLADTGPLLDEQGRIRLDAWELDSGVQAEVARRWADATTSALPRLGDPVGFRTAFRQVFGFDVAGVDYDEPVEIDVALNPS